MSAAFSPTAKYVRNSRAEHVDVLSLATHTAAALAARSAASRAVAPAARPRARLAAKVSPAPAARELGWARAKVRYGGLPRSKINAPSESRVTAAMRAPVLSSTLGPTRDIC